MELMKKRRPRPKIVDISIVIKTISNIDCDTKTCKVDCVIETGWNDSSVANGKSLVPGFDPQLRVVNGIDMQELSNRLEVVDVLRGRMLRRVEYRGKVFMQKMNMHYFPFDEQIIEIIVRPSKHGITKAMLHFSNGGQSPEFNLPSEWYFLGISAKQKRTTTIPNPSKSVFSSMHILIGIQRESDHHVANGFVPAFVLTCVSFTTYSIVSLDSFYFRHRCIIACIVLTLLMKFVVVKELKMVGSSMMMDMYVNMSLFCQLVALFATSLVQKYEYENQDTSRLLNIAFFLLGLSVYLYYHIVLFRSVWKYNTDVKQHWPKIRADESTK